MTEKWIPMTSFERLPYGILANVRQFMAYMEESIYGLIILDFIMDQHG
jgi:hypothetical protein